MQNQRLQLQFLSSWWWAVFRPKHVEKLRNIEIINWITLLYLVDSFYEFYITKHGSMDIKFCVGKSSKTCRCIPLLVQITVMSTLRKNVQLFFFCPFLLQVAAAGNQKHMQNQRLQLQFLSSWWWAVFRPKHVEKLRNIKIINWITLLHLVDSFYEFYITKHGSMDIKFCVGKSSKTCRCIPLLVQITVMSTLRKNVQLFFVHFYCKSQNICWEKNCFELKF
jgi:hypothetical protein